MSKAAAFPFIHSSLIPMGALRAMQAKVFPKIKEPPQLRYVLQKAVERYLSNLSEMTEEELLAGAESIKALEVQPNSLSQTFKNFP